MKLLLIILTMLLACNPDEPQEFSKDDKNKRYTTPIKREKHNEYIIYKLRITINLKDTMDKYQLFISDSTKKYEAHYDYYSGNFDKYFNPLYNYIYVKINENGNFPLICRVFYDDSLVAIDSTHKYTNVVEIWARW